MHVLVALLIGAIAGVAIGYGFRNAIGKDISKIKISMWISDLENSAGKDLQNVAAAIAAELKKL